MYCVNLYVRRYVEVGEVDKWCIRRYETVVKRVNWLSVVSRHALCIVLNLDIAHTVSAFSGRARSCCAE